MGRIKMNLQFRTKDGNNRLIYLTILKAIFDFFSELSCIF
jgi:hypothetical protein